MYPTYRRARRCQLRIHEFDLLATVHTLLGEPRCDGLRGRPVAALIPRSAGVLGDDPLAVSVWRGLG